MSQPLVAHNGDIQTLSHLCRRMALVYLRKKAADNLFHSSSCGVSLNDLALHVIVPLFRHDANGQCIALSDRFMSYLRSEIATTDQQRIRRMVFSAVEEELSKYYRALDPSLDELIRKFTAAALQPSLPITLRKVNELQWLVIDPREMYLPIIPSEFLGIYLGRHMPERPSIENVLIALKEVISGQTIYRGCVPVPLLAKAVAWSTHPDSKR